MSSKDQSFNDIVSITRLIRLNFQRLRSIADGLHADLGISASLRAIMEWLADHDQQTVPMIAEAKSVSRQHVQKTADELAALGLLEFHPNPAHKRSPFVKLTAKGGKRLDLMSGREMEPFTQLSTHWTSKQLLTARKFLEELESELAQIQGTIKNDDED